MHAETLINHANAFTNITNPPLLPPPFLLSVVERRFCWFDGSEMSNRARDKKEHGGFSSQKLVTSVTAGGQSVMSVGDLLSNQRQVSKDGQRKKFGIGSFHCQGRC